MRTHCYMRLVPYILRSTWKHADTFFLIWWVYIRVVSANITSSLSIRRIVLVFFSLFASLNTYLLLYIPIADFSKRKFREDRKLHIQKVWQKRTAKIFSVQDHLIQTLNLTSPFFCRLCCVKIRIDITDIFGYNPLDWRMLWYNFRY